MMSEEKSERSTGRDKTRARPMRSRVKVRDGSFVTGTSCK